MKRILLACTLFLILIAVLSGLALAQTGKIVVVGVPDRFKAGNKNQATTGLKSVGVNTRVVLAPRVYSTTGTKQSDTLLAVTSATWTLTDPKGVQRVGAIQDTAAGLDGEDRVLRA